MINFQQNGLVIAAIPEDLEMPGYLEMVGQLGSKLKCQVDLVHAVEPVNDYYVASMYGMTGIQSELILEIEKDRVELIKKKLDLIFSRLNKSVFRSLKVMVGAPDTVVVDYAKAQNAQAIVCGASPKSYQYVLSSMSHTLSLINNAFCPVIVIPGGAAFSKKPGQLSFLLADDLGEGSKPALVFTHRTQRAYPDALIHHAHVVKNYLQFSSEQSVKVLGEAPSEKTVQARIENALATRFGLMDELSKPEGKYMRHVAFGEVPKELGGLAEKFDVDFVVFGPHHLIKHKPFGFGSVSWTEMLHASRPVIVVPG
jgi:nucleotide-binding universal stress UspA family protein